MEENYDKYTAQKEEDEEEEEEEEGYIDMEVQLVAAAESAAILWEVVTLKQLKAAYQHSNGTSNSNHNKRHHHQYQHHHHQQQQQQQQQRRRDDSREFEFDMSGMAARSGEAECDSPADELFYKGQLLPLHMPPRMHMLQKLVLNSTSISHASAPHADVAQSFYSSPLPSPSPSPAPSSSRDVSGELLLLPLPQSSSSSSFGDARRPWKQRLKGACTAVLRTLREGGTINVTGCCSANAAPPRRPATETKQKQRQRERQRQRQREFMEAAAGRRGGVFKQQQQQQRRSFSETACRNRAATSAAAFKRSNSGVVSVSVSVDVENAIAHCKQCQAPRT